MRPTTDTARRTIFDVLQDRVTDAHVLDLFAGAGTLGIEALSRGAADVLFVERDRSACVAIERNLDATNFSDRARLLRVDVLRTLAGPPPRAFDLVFLDPPYERGLRFVARVLDALHDGMWVRETGTVVVEAETGQVDWPAGLSEIRTRRFGRTQVSMAVRSGRRAESHLPGDF